MQKYILFDLDGTLTDPGVGITNSVAHALEKAGITPPPREQLYPFIGPPLIESFAKFYGMDETASHKALDDYREYFTVKGLFENSKYDGIETVLQAVNDCGGKNVLATSKPLPFAERILEHFGISEYFYFLDGATIDEKRTSKREVIEHIFTELGIPSDAKANVLMVGDRMHDIIGAHDCGIKCCAASYGYGSREELEQYGADCIAGSIPELREMLVNWLQ